MGSDPSRNHSAITLKRMDTFVAHLIYVLAAVIARIPWPLQRRLSRSIGRLHFRRNTRLARATRRNMELIEVGADPQERSRLALGVLQSTVLQAFETLRFWTRSPARNLKSIAKVHGEALLDDAIATGNGVILAAPHYGSWELLNQWLAHKTPIAILYAPSGSDVGDAFLNLVRGGDRVTQVRADGATGVRTLLRILKQGGVIGILPDQQPKVGDGEYAPFFGYPALTMTLLSKLAIKTQAPVLMAYCERADVEVPSYEIHIEPADADIHNADIGESVAALNRSVESVARRDLLQYQWTYKRFTKQVCDNNPYYPDCY